MNFKKLNRILQIIWMAITLVLAFLIFVIDKSFLFYGLLLSFIIGVNHLIFAGFSAFSSTLKSPYSYHFFISVAYIWAVFFFGLQSLNGQIEVFYYLKILVPFCLAVYFWYITFKKNDKLLAQKHNVFDL